VRDKRLDEELLHSPFADAPPAAGARQAGTGVRVPGRRLASAKWPPDVVVAYDAAELKKGDGANVLYGDGHVEWLEREGRQDRDGEDDEVAPGPKAK